MRRLIILIGLAILAHPMSRANDRADLQALLKHEIIGPNLAMEEAQTFCETRVPELKAPATAADWDKEAARIRKEMLEKVVVRGEAAKWRDAQSKPVWLGEIAGGPGYRIKRLRFEALPGLWIPAMLYEPMELKGKVPVTLNVNGHDPVGKAAPYKQARCINFAKRGMLALNVEWLGMGQLKTEGFHHAKMNQIDLCGTGGIAVFYLAMSRAIDLLLAHPNADPSRLAVMGLSGGGWQTIFISSLDERVTLANPVAGYSSFRTRARNLSDLGDSEQTPDDMASFADYTHLTALRAPKPTLLTYNSKDNCCFASGHALQPMLDAVQPIFSLYGKADALRWHVNDDPGTHNFDRDNREAVYKMIGDHFFPGDAGYSATEIPSDEELKKPEELTVELPEKNEDFHTLAMKLAEGLPRNGKLPESDEKIAEWKRDRREKLATIARVQNWTASGEKVGAEEKGDLKAEFWKLRMGKDWTVPATALWRGEPAGTALLVADGGRASDAAAAEAERLMGEGMRVIAIDPFYFGESKMAQRDYLFALLAAGVGKRPLGIQAGEVLAAAQWAAAQFKTPVRLCAVGPRSGLFSLVAAAMDDARIQSIDLRAPMGSLKEVIEQNGTVEKTPEVFCFGLLEEFDVKQLIALAAPRPVRVLEPSDRARKELAGLVDWFKRMGSQFEIADKGITFTLPGGVPLEMVKIPAGSFQMGSSDFGWSHASETPVHAVTFASDFYMGKFEFTQGQWFALSASNPSIWTYGCGADYPVQAVSWNTIQTFLTNLNALGLGGTFRLPSEAEWEYAARAGTQTRFHFGNSDCVTDDCTTLCELGNYAIYCANDAKTAVPVGQKLPNQFGLYDTMGNVREWVEDDYHGNYSGAPTDGSAWIDTPRASSRKLRGGSWFTYPIYCRPASRISYSASFTYYYFGGFRLAWTP